MAVDLADHFIGQLIFLQILDTRFGRNGKALWHRQADSRHFRQIRALST
ncbi:hypothetical protein SDC9_164396 [bioreactor metagenome]|uniref:Uncharacterized protein n=1 Tax=bioreactor metagenome TaxID=1076179 RepID=A0A645FRJ4_9ZZZZ